MTQLQTELREWEEKKASAIASHRTAVTRLLLWACVLEVIFIVWYTVPPPAPIFLLLPRSSQSAGWLRPGRRTPQLLSPLRLVLEPHLHLCALHCRYYFCTSPTDVLDHATYIAPALLIPILYVPLPTTHRHPGLISYVSQRSCALTSALCVAATWPRDSSRGSTTLEFAKRVRVVANEAEGGAGAYRQETT